MPFPPFRRATALALTGLLLLALTVGLPAADVPAGDERATATFAGGCFWCMEGPFDVLEGVISTTSGYTGGDVAEPSYEQVSAGGTGHAEAVEVVYDPRLISYERLLEVFWRNVDPTTADRQFCDRGDQYRPAIFVHDATQRAAAEASRAALAANKPFSGEIVVTIEAAGPFYTAEEYHQDYYRKNPFRYRFYRTNCGRDRRLEELWGSAH
jgi:peptide-methionine (S)-S-oxide reductase